MGKELNNPQNRHRRSIRLQGYDYSQPGAYFVTIVTYHREKSLGQIVDGIVGLSDLGFIVREEWFRSTRVRKEICLFEDEFVVMPNHIHGIVWMIDPTHKDPSDTGAMDVHLFTAGEETEFQYSPAWTDGRVREKVPTEPGSDNGDENTRRGRLRRDPRSLGAFVAGFKASVTARARREIHVEAVWQRNYFEHILRNDREFHEIWAYIDANPQRWEEDQLNPCAPDNRFKQD